MENHDEWDNIIQEEIENMLCRLRDRGVDADRFEVTIKGQRAVRVMGSENFYSKQSDFENLLKNLKTHKTDEKYKICEKCGERILESEINIFKNMKVCDECLEECMGEEESDDFNTLENLENVDSFISFLKSLMQEAEQAKKIQENQTKSNQQKKRKKKQGNDDKNKD